MPTSDQKYLLILSKEDQRLIQWREEKISYRDIQRRLGYSNPGALRKRIHDIKKILFKRIQNDPEFRNLNNNS